MLSDRRSTVISIFPKVEPKKQRPVCNIDESTYILMTLVRKILEY